MGVKWKNKSYLLAFLCGVIIINMLGANVSSGILNRYSLAAMSFNGIVYEEYFFYVLLLRFRTVLGLWIACRILPRKWVMLGFAYMICVVMGGIAAMSIMENGLWGVLFCAGAFFPHGICYGVAYGIWSSMDTGERWGESKKDGYLRLAVMMLFVGIGSMLESYVSPVLLQNIIKY